jgi:hypothetical protein
MKISKLFLLCLGLVLCQAAYGDTITFDDLPANGFNANTPPTVPHGYQGLNWTGFFVYDTLGFPLSGQVNGTVSPNNVIVNTISTPASISAATPFFLESGYFTSAHKNGETLEIVGLNGSTTEFDETFIINATAPSLLTFPDLPVTELDFTATGGDIFSNPTYLGGGPQMVIDNLNVEFVPDAASTALLLAASVGGLALLRKNGFHRP